jgi:hypothetical protein
VCVSAHILVNQETSPYVREEAMMLSITSVLASAYAFMSGHCFALYPLVAAPVVGLASQAVTEG